MNRCQLSTCLVKCPVRSRLGVHAYDGKRKQPILFNNRKEKNMEGYTFEFDINKVMFEEQYKSNEHETVTLYFFAPKEWLGGSYPNAISAEISVEYPVTHPEAIYATVMMSPTRVTENDSVEDYDWYDIVLLPTEIEQLMDLATKALREEVITRVLAEKEKAQKSCQT